MYAETFNNVTKETRLESYLRRPAPRCRQILHTLGNRRMTARQLMVEMGFSDMNSIKPRLTELQTFGLVRAVGKCTDGTTGRTVAVWEAIK